MKSVNEEEEEVAAAITPRQRSTSRAALHRTTSTSEETTLPRQRSAGSLTIPKTLNARASLVVAAHPRSLTSPRLRTVSVDSNRQNVPPLPMNPLVTSSGEEDSSMDDEEYEALEAKKQFITEKMKQKNKPIQRMSVGNINFIERPLSDFCVTEASTPYSTPPPERNMSSDVAFREVATLKSDIRKLRDEIAHMHKQQQEMNNFYYILRREKEEADEETKNQCFLFPWL